ncbi:MAG: type II toxin-antitoxin system HicA family toxin [Thermacetogeniaceae bacterium]
MKSYSSRELIRMIQEAGWVLVRVSGSHYQFKHPTKPGLVTIPHPRKNLPLKTVKNILRQAGLED